MDTKMTSRDFFTAIASNEAVATEYREYAENALAKLDAKNAKRSSKPTKAQLANEPIKAAILAYLTEKGTAITAPDIAVALSTEETPVTHNKVTALCRQLVTDKVVEQTEVKIPKKGTLKAYSVVVAE